MILTQTHLELLLLHGLLLMKLLMKILLLLKVMNY